MASSAITPWANERCFVCNIEGRTKITRDNLRTSIAPVAVSGTQHRLCGCSIRFPGQGHLECPPLPPPRETSSHFSAERRRLGLFEPRAAGGKIANYGYLSQQIYANAEPALVGGVPLHELSEGWLPRSARALLGSFISRAFAAAKERFWRAR